MSNLKLSQPGMDDVMDVLDCIWEDVHEIYELHKGRELNV